MKLSQPQKRLLAAARTQGSASNATAGTAAIKSARFLAEAGLVKLVYGQPGEWTITPN